MDLKPGTRLSSSTCDTVVVVVRAPDGDVDLRCGGSPMVGVGGEGARVPIAPEHAASTLMGKRYVDDDALELLVTKAGDGSLSIGEVALVMKEAKALPASD